MYRKKIPCHNMHACTITAEHNPLELGSAQTRSWRTASSGFAGVRLALRSSAKPLEAVRQDRVWAEPSSRGLCSVVMVHACML